MVQEEQPGSGLLHQLQGALPLEERQRHRNQGLRPNFHGSRLHPERAAEGGRDHESGRKTCQRDLDLLRHFGGYGGFHR